MSLIQKAPSTPEELEACKPLAIPPEEVLSFDEKTWYERAYRGDHTPQLTVRAIVMGALLGFFLAFTNLYIGLKTGWHLGVAITASILSFSVWNVLQRARIAKSPMTILENNCMQSTASSAGYSTGSTLVSAFPALLLLSATPDHPEGNHLPWPVVAMWVFLTACLGVLLAIPMKRNMINRERLKFPSGVAAAVTLQSLYSEGKEALVKARTLFVCAAIGGVLPLLKDLGLFVVYKGGKRVGREALIAGSSKVFDWLPQIHAGGKAYPLSAFNVKLDNSLVLIAAGAIIGLRATLSMMLGAIVLVWFVAPHALEASWTNALGNVVTAATAPNTAWKEIGIWIGAPMMVSHGLVSFLSQWRTVGRALGGMIRKDPKMGPYRDPANGEAEAEAAYSEANVKKTEVPIRWFAIGGSISAAGIVILAWRSFGIPLHLGLLAVLLTFFLALVACRATGETDVTPTGAMGKIMQLSYGVLIPQSSTANLMTAAITSGSASASADLLNDLKSGYLLGANPRRQFVAQFAGIFSGTVATVLGYYALVPDARALTGENGKDPAFAAPAAQQWKAVAEIFKVGIKNLHPMAQHGIMIGVAIGVSLALIEMAFPKVKTWLPSATGLGLGFVLPFYYPLAMFIGALIAAGAKKLSPQAAERFTVPVSSGIIAGESIVGVIVAIVNNFILS
ncbi:OPT family oligopeptide transporter [soil metagenome]